MKWPMLALGLLLLVAAPALAVAPAGKHYAGMLVVLDTDTGEVEFAPTCLSFTRTEVCNELGDCGAWTMVERKGRQNFWKFSLAWEEEDMLFEAECAGMTERGGPKSAIAGTALVEADGVRLNASFAGVATRRARCLEFGLSDD